VLTFEKFTREIGRVRNCGTFDNVCRHSQKSAYSWIDYTKELYNWLSRNVNARSSTCEIGRVRWQVDILKSQLTYRYVHIYICKYVYIYTYVCVNRLPNCGRQIFSKVLWYVISMSWLVCVMCAYIYIYIYICISEYMDFTHNLKLQIIVFYRN